MFLKQSHAKVNTSLQNAAKNLFVTGRISLYLFRGREKLTVTSVSAFGRNNILNAVWITAIFHALFGAVISSHLCIEERGDAYVCVHSTTQKIKAHRICNSIIQV